MTNSFGSLGDLFPEKEVKCRIRGCGNLIVLSGNEAMQHLTRNPQMGRQDKMCQSCYDLFVTLQDQDIPCAKPGCQGKWLWNRFQQLEAHAAGRAGAPPRGLCAACLATMKEHDDVPQPCRVKGCTRTWVWTRRMQMESSTPPRKLCDECFKQLNGLHDLQQPCRIKGCENTWNWNRHLQLEHLRAGHQLQAPPRRLCNACAARISTLKNIDTPCKVHGCKNTWTYSTFEQLESLATAAEGSVPATPARMCKECFAFFNNAAEQQQPCRNRNCKNTWTWTRSMQLAAKVHGQTKAPARMCDDCQKRLAAMTDVELPCSEQGCTGFFIYKPEEQLRNHLNGHTPPQKRCKVCQDFLNTHQPEQRTCETCGQTFTWSTQEQLQCSLGVFGLPTGCADCNSRAMAESRPPEAKPEPRSNAFHIHVPHSGPWSHDHAIRDWPEHFTPEAITAMEQADVRIVCIGDDQVWGSPATAQTWPAKLAQLLDKRGRDNGKRIAVANAGIPACTTAQGTVRLPRDAAPFAPHLLIFSFAFADARLRHGFTLNERQCSEHLDRIAEDFQNFVAAARDLPTSPTLLCCLPNPVFPLQSGDGADWRDNYRPDEAAAKHFRDVARQLKQRSEEAGIAFFDGITLFEVSGIRSAMRLMQNWYLPGDAGTTSIAGCIDNAIRCAALLP